MQPVSLYLHIPFCRHRCGYCDFNTFANLEPIIPAYVQALAAEMDWFGAWQETRIPVHTIFFGGGTPSLLLTSQIQFVLEKIFQIFDLHHEPEITLEANPGTLSPGFLKDLRELGVNRLSLGMQSAHPGELILLEREHSYTDVIKSFTWARKSGFEDINLDLIFGLPGQDLQSWKKSLGLGLGLHPEHLSLYSLTIEHGTPFASWLTKGLIQPPDPDAAADMYEWAAEKLEQNGYIHYEISNWARKQSMQMEGEAEVFYCRHNLQYWRNQPYLGFGAGAHGFFNGVRTANVLSPNAYIRRMRACYPDFQEKASLLSQEVIGQREKGYIPAQPGGDFYGSPAAASVERISRPTEMAETMMMGMRLVHEGVSDRVFQDRFGISLEQAFPEQILRLKSQGLIEWKNSSQDSLHLTEKGKLLANRVFMEFLD